MTEVWQSLTGRVATFALAAEWDDLVRPFAPDPAVSGKWLGHLRGAYAGPLRHYHTLEHVALVLSVAGGWDLAAEDRGALRLAAWFHDYVYDPRRRDNEDRSAAAARVACPELCVPPAVSDEVARLILLTRGHAKASSFLGGVFLDADLAILAAPEHDYARYTERVRREYEWLAEDDYRAGREKLLRSFLARPSIFFTDAVRNLLEIDARRNLLWELALLGM